MCAENRFFMLSTVLEVEAMIMTDDSTGGCESAVSCSELGKQYHAGDRPLTSLWHAAFPERARRSGGFWALRDVSFHVKRGEVLGVLGLNGAGKSTLLQIVAGTLTATTGSVACQGRVAALLELGSGFNPEFTGRENARLNGAILGLTPREIEDNMDDIAAFADVGEFFDQPVRHYSSGMFVRLAFSVQVCSRPDVLIIDEALSVGDILFQQKCLARIRAMVAEGTAVMFVTHDIEAVSSVCDRVLLLVGGRLAAEGKPRDVLEAYIQTMHRKDKTDTDRDLCILEGTDLRVPATSCPRHGDGRSTIAGFRLESVAGLETHDFTPGQATRLTMRVALADRSVAGNLNVGFRILDRFGKLAFGTNSEALQEHICIEEVGGSKDVHFDVSLMIGVGEYSLTLVVASSRGEENIVHDWIDQVIPICIHEEPGAPRWGHSYCPVRVRA